MSVELESLIRILQTFGFFFAGESEGVSDGRRDAVQTRLLASNGKYGILVSCQP